MRRVLSKSSFQLLSFHRFGSAALSSHTSRPVRRDAQEEASPPDRERKKLDALAPPPKAYNRQTTGRHAAFDRDSSNIVPFRKRDQRANQLAERGNQKSTGLGNREKNRRRSDEHSIATAPKPIDSRGPLLKDILAEASKTGSYEVLEAECDRRLASGEHLDRRMVTTLIRSFGTSGKIEKAISRKYYEMRMLL
jgi:hypothetical protein